MAWLIDLQASMIGVDFVTPDMPFHIRKPEFQYPVHRGLLSREILIIENLNLEAVAGRRLYVEAFPLPIRGGDAAPARVSAVLI